MSVNVTARPQQALLLVSSLLLMLVVMLRIGKRLYGFIGMVYAAQYGYSHDHLTTPGNPSSIPCSPSRLSCVYYRGGWQAAPELVPPAPGIKQRASAHINSPVCSAMRCILSLS